MHSITKHTAQEMGESLLEAVDMIDKGASCVQIVSVGNAKLAIATDTFTNCDYLVTEESSHIKLAVSNEK